MSGDAIACGVILLAGVIVMIGGLAALVVFGAHEHSAAVIATAATGLGLIAAAVIGHAWHDYREYHPRERRIVQKGARWP